MKVNKILSTLFLFFIPAVSFAHTKWFAESKLEPIEVTEPTLLYLAIAGILMTLIVVLAIELHQKNKLRLCFLEPQGNDKYKRAASAFAMISGSFFLIAGTHEYLFSPNQSLESGTPMLLITIQIIIGLAFMIGIGTRISAVLLSLLWLGSFHFVGTIEALENIWVLSTALFIMIMGNDYFSLISYSALREIMSKFKTHALSILRIGTGLTLMVLGFSEKILAPQYGLNFLELHSWNFMEKLGFTYSDYLFTISAGAVEFLLGFILVLGVLTRFTALVTAVIFTIPLFILGPIELAGHIPHFTAIVLLILFGNGGHFVFFRKYKDADFCVYHPGPEKIRHSHHHQKK